jgi:NAD(P)H-dependent FMN reductase
MPRIQVIVGSTRPVRIGRQVAEWALSLLSTEDSFEWELVDLLDWPLPNDEPAIPATGEYLHEHTRAWSRKIGAAAGYVFVTPQYNWGYPASLKNAIDHLHREWLGKPAVVVSYGHRGGGKAAAQLRQVLEGLKMPTAATMPAITFTNEMRDQAGLLRDPAGDFSDYAAAIVAAGDELKTLLNGTR